MLLLSEVGRPGGEADLGGIVSPALDKLGFARPNGRPSGEALDKAG